jgi:hypothetical protein
VFPKLQNIFTIIVEQLIAKKSGKDNGTTAIKHKPRLIKITVSKSIEVINRDMLCFTYSDFIILIFFIALNSQISLNCAMKYVIYEAINNLGSGKNKDFIALMLFSKDS